MKSTKPINNNMNRIKLNIKLMMFIISLGLLFIIFNLINKTYTRLGLTDSQELSIVYHQTTFDTKNGKDYSKVILSNLDNTKKQEIDPEAVPNYFLPSGTKFIKLNTLKGISTSKEGNFNNLKNIVDISKIPGTFYINGLAWSEDEKTIVYDVFRHISTLNNNNEEQIYSIGFDGGQPTLLGKINNITSIKFLGYDFKTGIAYSKEGGNSTESLVSFDIKNSIKKTLFTLSPANNQVVLTSDYSTAYYSRDNITITSVNLKTLQKTEIFDISKIQQNISDSEIGINISPDNHYLFVTIHSPSAKSSNKVILTTESKSVDISLSNPKYNEFRFNSFSPDSKYVALISPITPDFKKKEIYSSKICLWDLVNKKIIPFINCTQQQDKFLNNAKNQDYQMIGWIQNKKKLILKNRAIPTAIPTVEPTHIINPKNDKQHEVEINNMKRLSDMNLIMNALKMYIAENNSYPKEITAKVQDISKSQADVCKYIVPKYLVSLPNDSQLQTSSENNTLQAPITDCNSSYETGYTIVKHEDGNITLSAPLTEEKPAITVTR